MSATIHQFPSKSSAGVVYTASVASDGTAVCNCPGFIYSKNRSCTHTKQLGAAPAAAPQATLFDANPTGWVDPMLASALKEDVTFEDFNPTDWVMEEKYDGHRLIVKVDYGVNGQEITAWSRAGNVRPLSRALLKALSYLPEGTFDGELLIPGGTATDVKALDKVDGARYAIFDILKVGEQSCMDVPGTERRKMLELACSKLEGELAFLVPQVVPSKAALQAIWDAGREGAILKRKNAVYLPTKRTPDWVKFKKFCAAHVKITGFEKGLLGPYSRVTAVDPDGIEVIVKSLNDQWRADFAKDPGSFIGRTLVISYTTRTKTGKYQNAMADHIL